VGAEELDAPLERLRLRADAGGAVGRAGKVVPCGPDDMGEGGAQRVDAVGAAQVVPQRREVVFVGAEAVEEEGGGRFRVAAEVEKVEGRISAANGSTYSEQDSDGLLGVSGKGGPIIREGSLLLRIAARATRHRSGPYAYREPASFGAGRED